MLQKISAWCFPLLISCSDFCCVGCLVLLLFFCVFFCALYSVLIILLRFVYCSVFWAVFTEAMMWRLAVPDDVFFAPLFLLPYLFVYFSLPEMFVEYFVLDVETCSFVLVVLCFFFLICWFSCVLICCFFASLFIFLFLLHFSLVCVCFVLFSFKREYWDGVVFKMRGERVSRLLCSQGVGESSFQAKLPKGPQLEVQSCRFSS